MGEQGIDWKAAARHYRTLYHEAVEKGCSDRDFWCGRTFAVEREGAEHRRQMQAEINRLAAVNRAAGDVERIAELEAALRHLEVIVDDAISVGEMQGEDFRLSPWADMQAVSGRYAHLTALSASIAPRADAEGQGES